MQIKVSVFPSLITLVLAVESVGCKLTDGVCDYSCCQPKIEFNQSCELHCSLNDMKFAYYNVKEKQCTHPCEKIEDGVMILKGCPAFQAQTVCEDDTAVTMDETITYRPQLCSGSGSGSGSVSARGNQGFIKMLLLLLMLMMLI